MRKINSISVCFTLIFFFAFFSNQCFSRESNCCSAVSLGNPEIRCVSVDNFGDVTISWLEIDDPLGIFIEYRVYSSISGGPFTLIGSETNRLTTTFIDIGANANLASVEYYISCVSNLGGAILEENSLDTLASIFLDLTNPSNGTAILQWNDVTNPSLSTMSNYYHIYMELCFIDTYRFSQF